MSLVETDLAGGVLTITLADEENRNGLGPQLMSELIEVCDAADDDPTVRVVVLTNRGRIFCAGANLSQASAGSESAASRAPDPARLFGRFQMSPKPYVGRIAGHCVAGGMGLAAAMDIAFAADDAMFGFTEVRIGVAPAVVSVVCLPKMNMVDARSAMLRGRRFPAAEAARMGLIAEAVPREQLDTAVDAAIADLLAGGPAALAATKQLLVQVPAMASGDAFAWARNLSSDLFRSDEAAEGMRAFKEKRPPSWVPS